MRSVANFSLMIEIDSAALQAAKRAQQAAVARHASSEKREESKMPEVEVILDHQDVDRPLKPLPQGVPSAVMLDLWHEMIRIKKERDIISSRTAKLVDDTIEALNKENPEAAKAFLAGELPMPEIKEQYDAIQARTDAAMALFDRIRHIEQYGNEQPQQKERPQVDDDRVDAIKQKIRRLDDLIYKTGKKLEAGKAKNPSRIAMWREKLSMDEARRDELKAELKRLQYEAREKRVGKG